MSSIGDIVLAVVMACAVAGAIASIRDDEKGLGKEFLEGLRQIGHIFIPVAGIMASLPYLSRLVASAFGPLFGSMGADPAIAATSVIAVDMGGYQLAHSLGSTPEARILAMLVGYMAGATIVFSIPVGLSLLDRRDHKYLALGVMSGVLAIPIGVATSALLLSVLGTPVRLGVATQGDSTHVLQLTAPMVARNLLPLVVFVSLLAAGLRWLPDLMIRGFSLFGKLLDSAIKLVLVASIVQYFTGFFSRLFGHWGFDPIIADARDQFRALEIAGYIGVMLSGAFPMVYLLRKYLGGALERLGRGLGLGAEGAAGVVAAIANILAMYRLIPRMTARDKVLNISFAVCAAFLLGDHLAFTANFQPNLIVPVLVGKLTGGLCGMGFAYVLSVPKALALEALEASEPSRRGGE